MTKIEDDKMKMTKWNVTNWNDFIEGYPPQNVNNLINYQGPVLNTGVTRLVAYPCN